MGTPPIIDVEACLIPISDESPSGESLAYESEFDELKEARRFEDDTLQGEWRRKTKVADWDRVIDFGQELLQKKTKDLQIAAWITEALGRKYAFGGLRDGLKLMLGIQDQFWDTYFPEIDDGDLDSRSGPFVFLDSVVAPLIRTIPLTKGFNDENYSFFKWQEARNTDNVGLRNQEAMDALIAEGKITGQQFEDAVAQTPRAFYETTFQDLLACIETLRALDDSMDQRFGRESPGVGSVRKALNECRDALEPILNEKRELEPDPDDPVADVEESSDDGYETEEDSDAYDSGYEEEEAPRVVAPKRRVRPPARSSGGPISSVTDAHQRILEAAAYLREHEPTSPVPFAVTRALRLSVLYGMESPPDISSCEAPSSETRALLRRLERDGEWDQLLEAAEQAIGQPEGTAWLDAHRFAIAAMTQGDTSRYEAANVCKSLLRAYLADFPELTEAELSDGTPTANSETRRWLAEDVLPPPSSESSPEASYSEEEEPEPEEPSLPPMPPFVPARGMDEPQNGPVDAWTEALELVEQGRMNEAIARIRNSLAAASSGRERFQRKLQLAELCLMTNRHQVALPLSEDLARVVDEFRLEEWEAEALCARVWAAYYRCLRSSGVGGGGASNERLQQVFSRLCRLDINQALSLEGDAG